VVGRARQLGWAAVALWGAACAELSYVGKAEMAYDDGRYFEVAEALAAREGDMRDLPAWKRARYGVYRGLSLLRLGEYEGAAEWLEYARKVDAEHRTLAPEQRRRLEEGLEELARAQAVDGAELSRGAAP
jgi:hypothetical protein